MKNRNKIFFLTFLWVSTIWFSVVFSQNRSHDISLINNSKLISELFESKDTVVDYWQQKKLTSIYQRDTLEQIKVMSKLGSIFCNIVDYEKSYENYWNALFLAEKQKEEKSISEIYNGLAILYDLYNRKNESLNYYNKSLNIKKRLYKKGEIEKKELLSNYTALANFFFYDNNPLMMSKYTDSCIYVAPKIKNSHYYKARLGYLEIANKKYKKAEGILLPLVPYFEKSHKEYLIIFYSALGDLYLGWDKPKTAVPYYKKSNQFALKYKKNLNFVSRNYERLSITYNDIHQEQFALFYRVKALEINEYLYSSLSSKNSFLLEIKDKSMEEKKRLNQLATQHKIEQLAHKESLWRLRSILIFISVIFLLILAFVLFRYLKTKHLNEKKILIQQEVLQKEQSKKILEIKNKELTESTLRLMAKEELLNEVKTSLKKMDKNVSVSDIKKLVKGITVNSKENWDEFESRFTMVNQGFYERMKEKFPELSPYDLKVSALIKLEFSGKEMARVMGISYESANTARYRLRKRLNLNKEDNLVEFVKSI